MTEEKRRVGFRIAFMPDSYLPQPASESRSHSFRLSPARPLNPGELLRLAPAVDPYQTLLLAGPDQQGVTLSIWGAFHTGTEWWKSLSGRSSRGASLPPDLLTISSFAPGELTISASGEVFLRLRSGTLISAPLGDLTEGPLGRFFAPASAALYEEVCRRLRRRRYDEKEDSDAHPTHAYLRCMANILRRARELAHGSTFLVVRHALSASDPRLKDRVALKYSVDSLTMWPRIVDEAVSRSKFYDLYFGRRRGRAEMKDNPQQLHFEAEHLESIEGDISDLEALIASFSGVDGAVVLTDRLAVLGFGGEIVATSPALSHVRIATDPEGKDGQDREITSYGTRHRSALRFCSSLEDAVAFVVSQDGDIRAIKRDGPILLLWDDLDLSERTI